MDTCVHMAESLRWSPETITASLTGYSPIQNKKLKKTKQKEILYCGQCLHHMGKLRLRNHSQHQHSTPLPAAASKSPQSDSSRPHRWQPTRLHHPWDSPGKNTRVNCHCLLCTGPHPGPELIHHSVLATYLPITLQANQTLSIPTRKSTHQFPSWSLHLTAANRLPIDLLGSIVF